MSLSASEFFEAGMSLPPSVREDVAIRLLESLEVAGQESVDESWTAEIGSRVDEMVGGQDTVVHHEALLAELATAFAGHDYDLKLLTEAIVASRAYQLTSAGGPAAESFRRKGRNPC